jgi:hypothetical protein
MLDVFVEPRPQKLKNPYRDAGSAGGKFAL